MCVQRENCQDSVFPGLNLVYSSEQVLWLNLFFAALEDNRESVRPKLLRDLRCAYELILDHRHSRLSVVEVVRAIKEAASATPLAFSPGSSRGASPGGRYSRYGQTSGYHHSSSDPPSMTSHSPTASSPSQQHETRLAEETTRALMQTGLQQHAALSSNSGGPPPPSVCI